jgi:hypothetical protein
MGKVLFFIISFFICWFMVSSCSKNGGKTETKLEMDSDSVEMRTPYFSDMNETEVTFSDDGDTLLRFPRNSEMTEYEVPEHVKYIEERAFQGCKPLQRVTIPASVNHIEMAAFDECSNLKTVYLYAKIDTLPFRCFNWCEKLESIHLANTMPPVIEDLEETEEETIQLFFAGVNLEKCKIYVPSGSRQHYKNAYGWRLFKNLQ